MRVGPVPGLHPLRGGGPLDFSMALALGKVEGAMCAKGQVKGMRELCQLSSNCRAGSRLWSVWGSLQTTPTRGEPQQKHSLIDLQGGWIWTFHRIRISIAGALSKLMRQNGGNLNVVFLLASPTAPRSLAQSGWHFLGCSTLPGKNSF